MLAGVTENKIEIVGTSLTEFRVMIDYISGKFPTHPAGRSRDL